MIITGFNYIVSLVRGGIKEVVGYHTDYSVAVACAECFGCEYTVELNGIVVASNKDALVAA